MRHGSSVVESGGRQVPRIDKLWGNSAELCAKLRSLFGWLSGEAVPTLSDDNALYMPF